MDVRTTPFAGAPNQKICFWSHDYNVLVEYTQNAANDSYYIQMEKYIHNNYYDNTYSTIQFWFQQIGEHLFHSTLGNVINKISCKSEKRENDHYYN